MIYSAADIVSVPYQMRGIRKQAVEATQKVSYHILFPSPTKWGELESRIPLSSAQSFWTVGFPSPTKWGELERCLRSLVTLPLRWKVSVPYQMRGIRKFRWLFAAVGCALFWFPSPTKWGELESFRILLLSGRKEGRCFRPLPNEGN